MSDPVYCYAPDYRVLRNKFGMRDAAALERVERVMALNRELEGAPLGDFDLKHLRAIHRHLFQDVYDWAGEIRTVEIAKGAQQFMFRAYIETGMADVHRRLTEADFLRGLDAEAFAAHAAVIIGDVNYAHPFREGNGRTQLTYLRQLADQAGHQLDIARLGKGWIEASVAAHAGDYQPMATCIRAGLATGQ